VTLVYCGRVQAGYAQAPTQTDGDFPTLNNPKKREDINMSNYDNITDILHHANGIDSSTVSETSLVPDLRVQSHNEIISVNAIDIPENVNGGEYDPFTKIEVLPLYNKDGYSSNARNVRVMRESGKHLEAGTVGQNYLLITNKQVNDVCSEIRSDSGMEWEHDKIFFDGKRFRNIYKTQSLSRTLENGDVAYLMFTELNSYDGSQTAGFRIDFMILVCLNGMVSPKYGWDSRFRHSLGNVDWQEQIKAGALALTGQKAQIKLDSFAEACNTLRNPLNMDNLAEIRNKFVTKKQLPNLRYGEILTKYHSEDHENSIWDLMQAGTNTLWHREKMTNADFVNNGNFVDGLLDYGKSLS